MITRDQAVDLVLAYLAPMSIETKTALVPDETITFDLGWVFFYQSVDYLESGGFTDRLAGNAPVIVDRRDGSLHVTGTGHPVEWYVKKYQRSAARKPPTELEMSWMN